LSVDFGKNLSLDFAGARENKIHQNDFEKFKLCEQLEGQGRNAGIELNSKRVGD